MRSDRATFGVSPGATRRLLDACEANDLPLLPGAATPSEAMHLLERGYSVQKFFPAEGNGGVPVLKAWGAPIPQVGFCPTGGVSLKNARDYLALPNVVMTPHMGSATFEGRVATGEKVIANIRMWADGHRPPDQVLEGWA